MLRQCTLFLVVVQAFGSLSVWLLFKILREGWFRFSLTLKGLAGRQGFPVSCQPVGWAGLVWAGPVCLLLFMSLSLSLTHLWSFVRAACSLPSAFSLSVSPPPVVARRFVVGQVHVHPVAVRPGEMRREVQLWYCSCRLVVGAWRRAYGCAACLSFSLWLSVVVVVVHRVLAGCCGS